MWTMPWRAVSKFVVRVQNVQDDVAGEIIVCD